MKTLLKIETGITTPFFIASWLCCAIFVAIKSGYTMAKLEESQKEVLLNSLFDKA